MAKVVYRPSDGLVLKVLRYDEEKYTLGLEHNSVIVDLSGNKQLLLDINSAPQNFMYDESNTRFIEDSGGGPSVRVISSNVADAITSFMEELPALQDAIDYIDGIPDMFAAKVVLRKMVKAIYAIFNYTGMSGE